MKAMDIFSGTTQRENLTQGPGQTVAPGQTKAPGQTLVLGPITTAQPTSATIQRQIEFQFAKLSPIFLNLYFNILFPKSTTVFTSSHLADVQSYTGSNDVSKNIFY